MRPLIVGNWKMNGTIIEGDTILCRLMELINADVGVDVVVCPPFTLLTRASERLHCSKIIALGAQNVHFANGGAYTGEVSIPMIQEIGCSIIIVGHSERRLHFGESDELVAQKVAACVEAGVLPILCVGETASERLAGIGMERVLHQVLAGLEKVTITPPTQLVIAYEPLWAIGTGNAATPALAEEIIYGIRRLLTQKFGQWANSIRILYGGSVTSANIAGFIARANIDGALVGGASLSAEEFSALVHITATVKAR